MEELSINVEKKSGTILKGNHVTLQAPDQEFVLLKGRGRGREAFQVRQKWSSEIKCFPIMQAPVWSVCNLAVKGVKWREMMVASWAMYMFCQSNATAKVCTVKQALKSLFVAHSKIVLPKPQDSKLPNSSKDVITAHHAVPSHTSHDNRLSLLLSLHLLAASFPFTLYLAVTWTTACSEPEGNVRNPKPEHMHTLWVKC